MLGHMAVLFPVLGMFQENSIETCILSRVKQIISPGRMHETSSRTWCTGKTKRDRVEREVGGGIGMGNTCVSMADSCQCMTKTTKKIKTNKKKSLGQSGNNAQLWMCLVMKVKSDAAKNSTI